MSTLPDAIALFSGGLDSILAVKLLEEQGLNVLCVHFTSPFFGDPDNISRWERLYSLKIIHADIGLAFTEMLAKGPEYGFGKTLNPCIDCKIMQLGFAKRIMREAGASFIATGEVVGQRPMSQRRDALNIIVNKSETAGLVLRPLCALHLNPTEAERKGRVDRSRLMSISGRGRNEQLELARKFALKEIPTPAGGCRLTEKENSRRYWRVMQMAARLNSSPEFLLEELRLANLGRHLWRDDYQLCIGRNAADNSNLLAAKKEDDLTIKLRDYPGPMTLARHGADWPREILEEACAVAASYAPKAAATLEPLVLSARGVKKTLDFTAQPRRLESLWNLPDWQTTWTQIHKKG